MGTWSIVRELHDRATGGRGTFLGTLAITADAAGFRWDEAGRLTWDQRELPAYRRHRLRRQDGGWWLSFEDGRAFHPWVIGTPVIHPCRADTYRGLLTAVADETAKVTALRIRWDVRGPTKDHLIVSHLTRVQATGSTSADHGSRSVDAARPSTQCLRKSHQEQDGPGAGGKTSSAAAPLA